MNRRLPLIAGAVIVVMLIGWYVASWRPGAAHLRSAAASERTAVTQQAQLVGQRAALLAVQRKLPALESQLRAGEPALPVTASIDTVLDEISSVAVADDISWTNETTSVGDATATATTTPTTTATTTATTSDTTTATTPPSSPGDGSSTLGLSLTVSGSYSDMKTFIVDLEHRPRLIVIDSLALTPSGNKVSAAIAGRAFYDSTALPALPGR